MRVDFLIMGAGMAGTALSSHLAQHAKVLVLDKGAGMPLNTRGWPCGIARASDDTSLVRDLCSLSVPQLKQYEVSQHRPFLYAAAVGQGELLQQRQRVLQLVGEPSRLVTQTEISDLSPILKVDSLEGGLWLEQTCEINAAALHAYLTQQAQRSACQFLFNTVVLEAKYKAGRWLLTLSNGHSIEAGVLINAAGVRADPLAVLCGVAPKKLLVSERRHFLLPMKFSGQGRHNAVIAGIDGSYAIRSLEQHICLSSSFVPYMDTEDVQIEAQRAQIDLAYSIYQLESVSRLRARLPASSWVEYVCQAKDGQYVVGWEPGSAPFFWFTAFGYSALRGVLAASKLASALLLDRLPSAEFAELEYDLMHPEREMKSVGEWR